ncbi:heptaprenyl diphosphate synthase component II [Psychrobacillus sp. INOP01]|uniref:heptaprenyl diphosphate synthase component II n=1 Tax=Psychrobacillus sp. INOP01 TaxID=2829187 RepID=UPI001BA9D957|nr:heptaprenyl diphosphate synthase component II [Psychrobacillus sp. INOP01]QUG41413.1 heptaprenyl diphosphate synthase component II [Psychrobacillus sp. INOP01]
MDKMKLKLLYSDLKSDLDIIEKELAIAVNSSSHLLNEASLHLLRAGGKRIRPVFVLLAAKFGNYSIDSIKNVAVSVELIHMASLVHDDVIDDAETRRGRETVKAQWNNRVAMYTGDFLFANAIEYITDLQNTYAHEVLSQTMVELCIGEIIQIEDKHYLEQTVRDYLRRIKRKTAILISASCELGAIASDADEKTVEHLKRFGYYVGMSFQIIDDILDLTSTDEQLGKPAGSDLAQGNITLPVLYVKNDPVIEPLLREILEGTISDANRQLLLLKIRESDGINRAKQISNIYLQKALNEVKQLPANSAKKSLQNIALFMSKRKF